MCRAIGADNWRAAFLACAEAMLPTDTFLDVRRAADEMLQRPMMELRPGKTELTEQRRQSLRDARSVKEKAQRYEATKERLTLARQMPNADVGSFPSYYRKP